jgi:hypothetical protein
MLQVESPTIPTEAHSTRYYVSEYSEHKYMLPADAEERVR